MWDNPDPAEDPNSGILKIANLAPGAQNSFPAKEIVDAGFLELVRYGIRKPDDPLIVDSLKVVDAVLKVDTPDGAGLASLQSRWLRPARGRRPLCRMGQGPCVAASDGRTGAL
jgi:hypothetical protein